MNKIIQKTTHPIFIMVGLAILNLVIGCNHREPNLSHKTTPTMEQAKGYITEIERTTEENTNFRKVLYTSKHLQLVLMTLQPNEEIGEEVHTDIDQFFRIENGQGLCIINGHIHNIKAGDAIIVPAGSRHNIINNDSMQTLNMYTIYTPPSHKDGIIRATKKEADNIGERYDGHTTE